MNMLSSLTPHEHARTKVEAVCAGMFRAKDVRGTRVLMLLAAAGGTCHADTLFLFAGIYMTRTPDPRQFHGAQHSRRVESMRKSVSLAERMEGVKTQSVVDYADAASQFMLRRMAATAHRGMLLLLSAVQYVAHTSNLKCASTAAVCTSRVPRRRFNQ